MLEGTPQIFKPSSRPSGLGAVFVTCALIYHTAVRSVRKAHGNAIVGLFMAVFQIALMVAIFWVMFTFLRLGALSLRGDLILFLMSGVFLYLMHIRAMKAVFSADGPTSPMMQHGPMNTAVAILGAAIGALYLQVLAMGVILFVYHAAVTPIEIEDPVGAMGMLLLAWAFGIAMGLIFRALRPWWPEGASVVQTVWIRANVIASGKMVAANVLPFTLLALFSWNPLFHLIDQSRGFTFINYEPRYTSVAYPVWVTAVLFVIGMMAEFFTRKHASLSWSAGR